MKKKNDQGADSKTWWGPPPFGPEPEFVHIVIGDEYSDDCPLCRLFGENRIN